MDYDYDLPRELIAQQPASPRSSARLMVLSPRGIEHRLFRELPEYLEKGDALVLNNTKVLPARLRGRKATGGRVEVTLLRELGEQRWRCLVKGRVGSEAEVYFPGGAVGRVIKGSEGYEIVFEGCDARELMLRQGEPPLPPYVKSRVPLERYQTVYARVPGSIAAPTAGLHFTPGLLRKIKEKGVKIAYVTLHIGLGTFAPVRTRVEEHRMEPEYYVIDEENAQVINEAERVIAVGTTTVKTLESASRNGEVSPASGWSDLFIYPPYRFRARIHGLITNFHLPKSTVLMLVCAYAGRDRIFKAYREAVKLGYRFYSFGDAMLILKCLR
jgi:S-adenosylmethionine:tRNA ribosyltransferase-isomerase